MSGDIDRTEMPERLRRFADDWRSTFDQVEDSIFLMDRSANVVWGNRRFLQNIQNDMDSFSGRKCHELVRNETCASKQCPFKKFLEDGQPHTLEVAGDRGEPLLVMILPVFDADNTVVGAVHLTKDISNHKDMQQFVCLMELVSKAQHGINDGLSVVLGNMEVLKEYVEVLASREKLFEMLQGAVLRKSWAEVELICLQIDLFEQKVDYPAIMKNLKSLISQTYEGALHIRKSSQSFRFFMSQNTGKVAVG